ncbi:MAG: hypothetical protein WBQ86_16545 [Candidatus Binatus sp.]
MSETGTSCKPAAAQRAYPLSVVITLTHFVAILALASSVSAGSAVVSSAPPTEPKSIADAEQNKSCDDDSKSADDQSDSNTQTAAKPSRSDAGTDSDTTHKDGDCADDNDEVGATDAHQDDRPTLSSQFDYYSDSEHYVNLTTTSIATAFSDGVMMSLRRDWVQSEAPGEVQAAEITTLGFSKDFSEQLSVGGGFGSARAMRSTDLVGSLAAHFSYRGATVTATIARDTLLESARTMAANIRQTDFGLSLSDDLSEHISTDAEAHHHIYTDGNSSNDFALSPQYSFDLAGIKLETGYRFNYTGFAHNAPSGYWTPQRALSNEMFSALTFDRAWIYGHSELGLNYDLVRESGPLSNGPSSGPGASAAFALGIRPVKGTELETYWTGTGSAGWNSMNFGLSLKYIF